MLHRSLLAALTALAVAAPSAQAIVGGRAASPGEYPYVAHVLIDKRFQCTGTLVTPTKVITAAHCSSLVPAGIVNVPIGQPGQLIEVTLGTIKTPKDPYIDVEGERRTGVRVNVHPRWLGLFSVSGDVAVVTLDRPSLQPPVQIAGRGEERLWQPGKKAIIAGFGRTKEGGKQPDVLQEAFVPIVKDSYAAAAYPGDFENETQIGAGYRRGGVDTCQGDSGGPLLVPASDGTLRLVGDTSYGLGCARPGKPGIYGRLPADAMRSFVEDVAPGAYAPGTGETARTPRVAEPGPSVAPTLRSPSAPGAPAPTGGGPAPHREGGSGMAGAPHAAGAGTDPFRCVVEHCGDAFLLLDPDGRIADANAEAAARYGRAPRELVGLALADLCTEPDAARAVLGADESACRERPLVLRAVHRRADGSTFPAEVRAGLWPEGGRRFVLVRDLADREQDELTGLLTCPAFRRHAGDSAAAAKAAGGAVSVLHVDLNRFALVNRAVGREAGDGLLRQAAWRLRQAAGPAAVLARQSADAFLLLVPEDAATPGAAAEAAAERVHRALRAPFPVQGTEVVLDAAVGISVLPLDADGPEVLLRNAEIAAVQAKRSGWGPTRRFAGETSDGLARLLLAARLRRALDREELVVHYQPVVRLDADPAAPLRERLVGVEALVRLPLSDGSLVPPARFLPLAEDLGLVEALGEQVFGALCADAAGWAAAGLHPRLFCNLSLHELWQPALAERCLRQAGAHGIHPRDVVLEVTESAAMTDPVRTARVLRELGARGFRLAIDDFGAGHSSLARLAELPADVLKLDRLFVARLPEDRSAAALVAAMLELARNLGLEAVAEGVETDAQRRFLLLHGCRLGQGFLFGEAAPAAALAAP